MQVALKEIPNYEAEMLDDPLYLLLKIEKSMHVPRKSIYPTLALIETLSNLLDLHQGENDSLLNYLERFKSENNVFVSLFGDRILDGYIENTKAYKDIPYVDVVLKYVQQKLMKEKCMSNSGGCFA